MIAPFVFHPDLSLHVDSIEVAGNDMHLHVSCQHQEASCPDCYALSKRMHGHYRRAPQDLPCFGFAVRLVLKVTRFFCDNLHCSRRTFAVDLSSLLKPYARRTMRLQGQQQYIALAVGGSAGQRLSAGLSMPISRDSLLRLIRSMPEVERKNPRVIGVDDWAKRKGHDYGTIVVDLERQQIIDLLPDRHARTLADWLQDHPSVTTVARDRFKEYAQGTTIGAPAAEQVADRWHLLKNLREALERFLTEIYPSLNSSLHVAPAQGTTKAAPERPAFPRSKRDEEAKQVNRQRRMLRYHRIQQLKKKGFTIRHISRLSGLHRQTVASYYDAEEFPEKRQRKLLPSILDPYLGYLNRRYAEGLRNAKQLWREIRDIGYPGTYSQVSKWMRMRRKLSVPTTVEQVPTALAPGIALPTFKELLWLLFHNPADLDEEKKSLLQDLKQVSLLATAHGLIQEFRSMVRNRQSQKLDAWLARCDSCQVAQFQRFADSIRQDLEAVRNAMRLPWSNGQTEGQINKLKLLKRQMYGRANFDLLRQRALHMA